MTIEPGDRVRYNEENVGLDDNTGTVMAPTMPELVDGRPIGYVRVEWDDGTRFWEVAADLVVIEDPFGVTCLDCGEPIDDTLPYVNTEDGELLHVGCGNPTAENDA